MTTASEEPQSGDTESAKGRIVTKEHLASTIRQGLSEAGIESEIVVEKLRERAGFLLEENGYMRGDSTLFLYGERIDDIVAGLAHVGVTRERLVEVIHRFPQLLSQSADTLISNLTGAYALFPSGIITFGEYVDAAMEYAQIFSERPETICDNVFGVIKRFSAEGLTIEEYLPAILDHPKLFCWSSDIVEMNVREVVEAFAELGLTIEEYLKSCLKRPSLMTMPSHAITYNIKDFARRFSEDGLTEKKYLNAAKDNEQLYSRWPEVLEENVDDIVKRFEDEGLTRKKYIKAVLNYPRMLNYAPGEMDEWEDMNIEQKEETELAPGRQELNIREAAAYFEPYVVSLEEYLQAALKEPQLFCRKPEVIRDNIFDLVDMFSDIGLTRSDYLRKAALKRPTLFLHKPERIAGNVNGLVKQFEDRGLTTEQVFESALNSSPQILYQSPATMGRRVNMCLHMYERGFLTCTKSSEAKAREAEVNTHPVLLDMMKYPKLLSLQESNFMLRFFYATMPNRTRSTRTVSLSYIYSESRKAVEERLLKGLGVEESGSVDSDECGVGGADGQENNQAGIPKLSEDDMELRMRNIIVRGMIRYGMIQSRKLAEDADEELE